MSRIHSMELKAYINSIAWVSLFSFRIHSMELKGIVELNFSHSVCLRIVGNPFNGIESGVGKAVVSSSSGGFMKESIQWNWKIATTPESSIHECIVGIHSMELKAMSSSERTFNTLGGNPFNGIESGAGCFDINVEEGELESIQWNWKATWARAWL